MPTDPNLIIKRSQIEIHNGLRQKAKMIAEVPALAGLNANGARRLRTVSVRRGGQPLPPLVDVAVDLPNSRLILIPTQGNPDDAFAVRWTGQNRANLNLIEAFLSANLRVPAGHVQEVPVNALELAEYGGWCLVADLPRAVFRPVASKPRSKAQAPPAPAQGQAAATRQDPPAGTRSPD